MVKPLAEHFIGVRLDYWQLYEGQDKTKPGRFLRKMGLTGLDTADQVIVSPNGKRVDGPRSWKNRHGFTESELRAIARKYPGNPDTKNLLRLSWFLLDPVPFRVDLGDKEPDSRALPDHGFTSPEGAVAEARKARRPLVRVDGAALQMLEGNQEFLRRHLRQFWWQKGDPKAPARLVVLNSHGIAAPGAKATALTGACPPGRVPTVMATVDLKGGPDLARISPVLDRCWRDYMAARPSNADNLTFAQENVPAFKEVDQTIRRLAGQGRLLAPGGRPLFR